MADRVQLTRNGGNRPCNHPQAATDGRRVVWVYGTSERRGGNTRTYVAAVDERCNPIAERVRLSDDDGAPRTARTLFCAARGDERPPEDGVACPDARRRRRCGVVAPPIQFNGGDRDADQGRDRVSGLLARLTWRGGRL